MSVKTIAHINWIQLDSDGGAEGTARPHPYTLPNRPKPKKAT